MIPKLAKPNEDTHSKSMKRPSSPALTKAINENRNFSSMPEQIALKPTIEGNAKRRRASLLEVQNKINAVMDQVGGFDDDETSKRANNPRRKSLRISLLAANQLRNDVDWIDI